MMVKIYSSFFKTSAFCIAAFCLLTFSASAPAQAPDKIDIGVGLEGLADWSRALMFADAMKTSRGWGRADKPWEHTVKTDKIGWPLEDAGVVVIADVPHIGGTYRLSFEGKADVTGVASKLKVVGLEHDAKTNISRAEIVVDENSTQIMLAFTGTNGGVKNVRLMRPGTSDNDTFYEPFLEKLAPFSTLRFMDFLSTNNNPVKTWSERTTPEYSSQARREGGALEYVIELANISGKDIWVNVPDQADDEYVRQMALLLKNGLTKNQIVYVEWSNEVWNWMFEQAQRNLQAAKIEGAQPNSPLKFDGDNNEGYHAMRRIAFRGAQVGKIFTEIFGDKNFTRLRPVFATQVGYEEVYKQGLQFLEHQYDAPNTVFYGIAGAPYFQISDELNRKKDLTLDEIFAAIPENMARNLGYAKTLHTYARRYKLHHLAYEGGQHLQDHGDVGNSDVKIAANRDPRMGTAIEKYLREWFALGGETFMYFTLTSGYSKWGSWGLLENVTDEGSPKYDAVLGVLRAR
jgi:hypothetical protein